MAPKISWVNHTLPTGEENVILCDRYSMRSRPLGRVRPLAGRHLATADDGTCLGRFRDPLGACNALYRHIGGAPGNPQIQFPKFNTHPGTWTHTGPRKEQHHAT
jgi:hypothetical protein